MSNGFAGLGGVYAVELADDEGCEVALPGEVHVRQRWSASDDWTEVILDFGGTRRFIHLTHGQATKLAKLLCESTPDPEVSAACCDWCGDSALKAFPPDLAPRWGEMYVCHHCVEAGFAPATLAADQRRGTP